MDKKLTLFDMSESSAVIVKLLDMIEKGTGWLLAPKGKRRDFEEGLELYKTHIIEDPDIDGLEKAVRISTSRNELRKYINQGKIIEHAAREIKEDAKPEHVDQDWLFYFFEYAKNTSDEELQKIWGRLLAMKVNGSPGVTKRLINTFSVMGADDIEVFCRLCAMTLVSGQEPEEIYPFIYMRNHPSYYNRNGIKRQSLAQLDNLGLIEYDVHEDFVLPKAVPALQYASCKIRLQSGKRVSNGNVRFTGSGRELFRITKAEEKEDFIGHCRRVWDEMGLTCEIFEIPQTANCQKLT